ncbi:hypothetical protein J8273_7319 [Carpediemonas membranifera]|uniref:Uncharacterized protein n=1 Tax=Carpediemonas membranifera TaxID=201153 RepID=A0A8J6E7T2_9EUKA|nr:hypothetical protein J8273_7319 [Carpediemonas membranifera]|eukprot:KAG9391045.1 hypothetical protein J8273_7319 [Carpediemonas membranifera]
MQAARTEGFKPEERRSFDISAYKNYNSSKSFLYGRHMARYWHIDSSTRFSASCFTKNLHDFECFVLGASQEYRVVGPGREGPGSILILDVSGGEYNGQWTIEHGYGDVYKLEPIPQTSMFVVHSSSFAVVVDITLEDDRLLMTEVCAIDPPPTGGVHDDVVTAVGLADNTDFGLVLCVGTLLGRVLVYSMADPAAPELVWALGATLRFPIVLIAPLRHGFSLVDAVSSVYNMDLNQPDNFTTPVTSGSTTHSPTCATTVRIFGCDQTLVGRTNFGLAAISSTLLCKLGVALAQVPLFSIFNKSFVSSIDRSGKIIIMGLMTGEVLATHTDSPLLTLLFRNTLANARNRSVSERSFQFQPLYRVKPDGTTRHLGSRVTATERQQLAPSKAEHKRLTPVGKEITRTFNVRQALVNRWAKDDPADRSPVTTVCVGVTSGPILSLSAGRGGVRLMELRLGGSVAAPDDEDEDEDQDMSQ